MYIIGVFDNIQSPSSVVGHAAHKALEEFYRNGLSEADAMAVGISHINTLKDINIDYGKTGTREKIINTYTNVIRWYFEEVPTYYKIIGVEEEIETAVRMVTNTNGVLPLPIKTKIDLIIEDEFGNIEVIDHKFPAKYSDPKKDNFNHFLQCMFYYHAVKEKYGKAPSRVTFNECKTTKNSKDNAGMSQLQPYSIELEGAFGDFATFYALFESCTEFISREDAIYLPNPSDVFDGDNSFDIFRSGIIDVNQPTAVKTRDDDYKFKDKRFISSKFNQVGNENFTDEARIEAKLMEFGIGVNMKETIIGPSVIRYTMEPPRGIKMSSIKKMTDDLALALGADKVRIEAPIRGTSLVGVEVPNKNRKIIELGENNFKMGTTMIPIGVDILGDTHYADIADMPHLLIAGQTGSGKSVMLNVIIKSFVKQMSPENLKLLLIDPKQVELSMFDDIPHLFERTIELPDGHEIKTANIVTDVEDSINALEDVVNIMEERFLVLKAAKSVNMEEYNKKHPNKRMPRIVVIIDEFADLMLAGGKKAKKAQYAEIIERDFSGKPVAKYKKEVSPERPSVEQLVTRLGGKARAAGINLIIATQRPSVDVVTGIIKANVPSKIAFAVTSEINSKIILDQSGAEELTGKGDMLFSKSGGELIRLQGFYDV
jgi:DNA segregation ATPase FtsK/SpoIIIE-like protein